MWEWVWVSSRVLDVLKFIWTLDDVPSRMLLQLSGLDVIKALIRVSAVEKDSDGCR